MSIRSYVLVLCALAACAIDNSAIVAPQLDRALFATSVQPVLAARCATATCHGSDRRRLRVYAPGWFRADASRTHRDEPLTADELEANARSAEAFAANVAVAEQSLLVRKPLGAAVHLGGRVLTENDAATRAIVDWIITGGAQ